MIRAGIHVSIRSGFYGAARTAAQLGSGVYQYFPKNPRSLSLKTIDPTDAAQCAAYAASMNIQSVAHSSYLVNLAGDEEKYADAVLRCLRNDLEIAEACGSIGVVAHVGKYKGKDTLQGYRNIIQLLNRLLAGWHGQTLLLLENQANGLGIAMEELTSIRSLCDYQEKIGFCFDTCHAYAGGLWDGSNWGRLEETGASIGFWPQVKVVHVNDSRYGFATGKDAHANIGYGCIGASGFRDCLSSPFIRGLPLVLETPRHPQLSIQEELAAVKQLAGST